jgi:hypothetical protein
MAKSIEIPMRDPDGEPWIADSESEAHELMARGYKREDGGKQAPPAGGAKGSGGTKGGSSGDAGSS